MWCDNKESGKMSALAPRAHLCLKTLFHLTRTANLESLPIPNSGRTCQDFYSQLTALRTVQTTSSHIRFIRATLAHYCSMAFSQFCPFQAARLLHYYYGLRQFSHRYWQLLKLFCATDEALGDVELAKKVVLPSRPVSRYGCNTVEEERESTPSILFVCSEARHTVPCVLTSSRGETRTLGSRTPSSRPFQNDTDKMLDSQLRL